MICFLLPTPNVGIIFSRRKLYNMASQTRASRSRCHHYYCCTTSTAELLQQQNSSSSSSSGTHKARVSVAVRSARVGLSLEPFVHRTYSMLLCMYPDFTYLAHILKDAKSTTWQIHVSSTSATTTTAVQDLQLIFSCFSVSSSVRRSVGLTISPAACLGDMTRTLLWTDRHSLPMSTRSWVALLLTYVEKLKKQKPYLPAVYRPSLPAVDCYGQAQSACCGQA